jgi:serine/threonine protein phosphatase PrpC
MGQRLLVANVGDSRAVLSRGGRGEHRHADLSRMLPKYWPWLGILDNA